MRFTDYYLLEMAAPREQDINKIYYHGTSDERAALSILKNGINPPDLTNRRGKMTPVAGKVYITPMISYAMIYALGGDLAGSKPWKDVTEENKYGYVFEITGDQLQDIQPDEDSIGEILYKIYKGSLKDDRLNSFVNSANRLLTPLQIKHIKDAEYADWAVSGKKLLKTMSDQDKLTLIDLGAHIGHTGKLIPNKTWKIDKMKTLELKRDGSNFFDIAEEVL